MRFDIQEWYKSKIDNKAIINHYGPITTPVIDAILESMEASLHLESLRNLVRKKIFNVFVECLQNLYHHVDDAPTGESVAGIKNFGVIILSKEKENFKITTGNYLQQEKVELIRGRINQLNALTDEEIKALYLEVLVFEGHTKKGGAGLGMLDILRKSGSKLDCVMYRVSQDYSFFSLEVIIK